MLKKPIITPDLITYLQTIYPLRSPVLTDTDRKIWLDVGIQAVIAHLKNLSEQQKKEVM